PQRPRVKKGAQQVEQDCVVAPGVHASPPGLVLRAAGSLCSLSLMLATGSGRCNRCGSRNPPPAVNLRQPVAQDYPDLVGAGEDSLVAAVLHEVGALRLAGAGGHVDDAE